MNNREIKFRVWDTEFKRMLFYGPNYTLGFGLTLMETDKNLTNQTNAIVHNLSPTSEEGWYQYNKERFIIQQFTGLIDKNGNPIYDGDIIDTRVYDEVIPELQKHKYILLVFWDGFNHTWAGKTKNSDPHLCENFPFRGSRYEILLKKTKIIGNLMENADLLK